MSLLDEIREAVTGVFSDTDLFFSPATMTRVTVTGGGAYTEGTKTVETFDCLAILDTYSSYVRGAAGIPDTDVKIMVLQESMTTEMREGDVINIRGDWRVINVEQDPAQATWTAQARPV